jgi:hypothetical protein
MLEHLTDGLSETMVREDLLLSTNLENDFTNPGLHEQAAALLGAFALRENSGVFYDIRLALCRMTAHLALARFLSGEHSSGIVGQVADCMLLTGMNNEAAAIEQLDHLDTAQKPVAIWARTLRARNTLDFRPLDAATNVPGVEQVAWFEAYSAASSRSMAWTRIGKAVEDQPDFCRLAGAMGYDVGMGNVMLRIWLPLEIRESSGIYQQMQGGELSEENLVAALNHDPDRCFVRESSGAPRVRVIGWASGLCNCNISCAWRSPPIFMPCATVWGCRTQQRNLRRIPSSGSAICGFMILCAGWTAPTRPRIGRPPTRVGPLRSKIRSLRRLRGWITYAGVFPLHRLIGRFPILIAMSGRHTTRFPGRLTTSMRAWISRVSRATTGILRRC